MNRFHFAHFARALFHIHYDVEIKGLKYLHDKKVHLVMPNHPAFIDPLLLFAECWDVALLSMIYDSYFRNMLFLLVFQLMILMIVPIFVIIRRREDVLRVQ